MSIHPHSFFLLLLPPSPPHLLFRLFVWGLNNYKQLGLSSDTNLLEPTLLYPSHWPKIDSPLPTSKKIARVACGTNFSVVLFEDGSLYTWGNNDHGQLGLGHHKPVARPCRVPFSPPPPSSDSSSLSPSPFPPTPTTLIIDVACGWYHTLILTRDGRIFSCGRNEDGKLGHGGIQESHVFLPVHGFGGKAEEVQEEEEVRGEEEEGEGEGGGRSAGREKEPRKKIPTSGAAQIFCGGHHSLAITRDHELWGWGWNERGSLGRGWRKRGKDDGGADWRWGGEDRVGDSRDRLTPCFLFGEVVHASAGWAHTIALKMDGTVLGFGYNLFGQVGSGGERDEPEPTVVRIPFKVEEVKAIGATGEGSWAITKNGDIYLWGKNVFSENNSNVPKRLPFFQVHVPVWRESFWREVCQWVFLGRKEEGSVFSWLPVEVVYHVVGIL
jgi:alpha-tubulin suppressor-like RCC1 family protein